MFFGLFRKKAEEEYIPILPPEDDISDNISETLEEKCNPLFQISIASNVGLVRKQNEDNYYVREIGYRESRGCSVSSKMTMSGWKIFAVFDGMGGEAYGEEASRLAATALHEYSRNSDIDTASSIVEFVRGYIKLANDRICQMIEAKHCNRSGSTLALVLIKDKIAHVFNIGDSRVYHYTSDKITQITEDQTLAMKKLKANIYTEEEARKSSDSHKITSYLGVDNRGVGVPFLSYSPFEFTDGKLLICSDGLTDMCSDEEIEKILSGAEDNDAERLIDAALHNGGEDNVTCIVIAIEE